MNARRPARALFKNVAFPPLGFLPPRLLISVAPSYLDSYVRWLTARGNHKAACRLRVLQIRSREIEGLSRHAKTVDPAGCCIFIVGPPRVGKSTLARALAERLNYDLVYTDPLRVLYERIPDPASRKSIRESLLAGLVSERRGGLIVEGIALLDGEENSRSLIESTVQLAEREGAKIYLCGDLVTDPVVKRQSIRDNAARVAYDCWTNRLSDQEMDDLLAEIIATSRKLKNQSTELGLKYFEIGSADFSSRINDVAQEIFEDIRQSSLTQSK